jgi:hypothetical protein
VAGGGDTLSGGGLEEAVAASIARLNRAILSLNFRREPIYAPEEEIVSGRFARYRVGAAEPRLPPLDASGLPGPGHPQRRLGSAGRSGRRRRARGLSPHSGGP